MSLKVEDVELIEHAVLATINKMDDMLLGEKLDETTKNKIYTDDYANFFDGIQSSLQQEWIHLGRLKKRMQDDNTGSSGTTKA